MVINQYSGLFGGDVLSSKHRMFKKNFETEIRVNSIRLPLNHFMQETLANMMVGFLKTLKQVEGETPTSLEIRIKKLPKQVEVDAHTYP
jgi:IS4 transposase